MRLKSINLPLLALLAVVGCTPKTKRQAPIGRQKPFRD